MTQPFQFPGQQPQYPPQRQQYGQQPQYPPQGMPQAPQGYGPQPGYGPPPGMPGLAPQRPAQPNFDPFANLGNAETFERTPFFLVGTYEVQILSNDINTSRKDQSVYFGTNAKILSSSVPDTRPPGFVCRQSIKVTGNSSGLPNVKGFILALMGITSDRPDYKGWSESVNSAFLNDTIIGKQALAGRIALLECTLTTTKSDKPFTVHNWRLKA